MQDTYISSRANPLVQKYAKLTDKKYRESEKLFLLNGCKLFCEAVENSVSMEAVLLCEGQENAIAQAALAKMQTMALYAETKVLTLSSSAFAKISDEKSPDGVIGVAKYLDNFQKNNTIDESDICLAREKIMLLYSLRDPGNFGTIARSAAAFGFDRLIVSTDTADLYNARAMRASMGAFFRICVHAVDDFCDAVKALQKNGRRVLCAELRPGAVSVEEAGLTPADCIIVGNEGHGIPEDISALADGSVFIPIAPGAESLNAAVAASVIAFIQR